MASSRQQWVVDEFMAIVADGWRGLGGTVAAAPPEIAGATQAMTQAAAGLAETTQSQAQILASYAGVVASSPVYRVIEDGGGEGTASGIASAIFKNALGMVPLARAVLSLFGGGGEEEPPPLVKYALPAPLRLDAASTEGTVQGMDYGQDGLPRAYAGSTAANQTPAQVTVQVQAMDSRSFLDHKDDIARAVREAMLSMHPLNDVVSEL